MKDFFSCGRGIAQTGQCVIPRQSENLRLGQESVNSTKMVPFGLSGVDA